MSVSADMSKVERLRFLWIFLAIFLVAAGVRVSVAGRHCLWVDELFSLAIATGHSLEHPTAAAKPELGDFVEQDHAVPAEEFCRYVKHDDPPAGVGRVLRAVLLSDTNPPFYYLCLYWWTRCFGSSDMALRLFSTTSSLACLPFIAGISGQVAGRKAALSACVLFAFSPLAVFYSTEGRMYALLWLWVVAVMWASLGLRRNGGRTWAIVWVLLSAAGFLTHYFFAFVWGATVVILFFNPGQLSRRILLLCILATGLLILPWYVNLPRSLHSWRITKDWLYFVPKDFNRAKMALNLGTQFFSGYEKHLWPGFRFSTLTSLLLFVLGFVVMVWQLGRSIFSWRIALLWLSLIAACIGPIIFDLVLHTYTTAVPRYAIAGLPAAYLLAGIALACLRTWPRFILLGLILLSWVPNLYFLYRAPSRNYSALCDAAQAVNQDDKPSDLILVHSIPSGVIGVAHYSNKRAPIASWVGQLKNRQVPQSILALTAGRSRIWFVKVHEVGEAAPEESWLRQHANVVKELRMGATLVEFRPINAATF
jgi:hypothetical protein